MCRWQTAIEPIVDKLLHKPLKRKDRDIHLLICLGILQLKYMQTAEHAAIKETVEATHSIGKPWAKKVVNACLRKYQRAATEFDQYADNAPTHPLWLQQRIEQDWPQHGASILAENNSHPPMCLRVNRIKSSREDYMHSLKRADVAAIEDPFTADGIILQIPTTVTNLPQFEQGSVSVQDTAAQLICDIIAPEAEMQILDACAAPGGKTTHLLERSSNLAEVTAVDLSKSRLEKLHENIQRLELKASVYAADASQEATWPTPTKGYDWVLIDAPCSGTGVIRRHPDIRFHHNEKTIAKLAATQSQLLQNLWLLVKPGGSLLYCTCSVLRQENEDVVALFLHSQEDARAVDFTHPNALSLKYGKQTLPGVHQMDGFYYAKISKSSS